jgi:hypothetical protein
MFIVQIKKKNSLSLITKKSSFWSIHCRKTKVMGPIVTKTVSGSRSRLFDHYGFEPRSRFLFIPRDSMKDFQAISSYRRSLRLSKQEISEVVSWSCWSILPSWIRIHRPIGIRVQSENEKLGKLGNILPRVGRLKVILLAKFPIWQGCPNFLSYGNRSQTQILPIYAKVGW